MLTFDRVTFRYEPYPIGYAKPAMDKALYEELAGTYPDLSLFTSLPKHGHKYTLSQKNHAEQYQAHIRRHAAWQRFHAWIKSEAFIDSVDRMLCRHGIDLGLEAYRCSEATRWQRRWSDLRQGRLPRRETRLRTRFEFSALPADGGFVPPHTDTPRKLVTLIVSMIRHGEWNPEHGGGTQVLRPRDIRKNFNYLNTTLGFDEVEEIDTFEFTPNQCVIFVKTFNSLHAVQPMVGQGSQALRKTLTINIETDE